MNVPIILCAIMLRGNRIEKTTTSTMSTQHPQRLCINRKMCLLVARSQPGFEFDTDLDACDAPTADSCMLAVIRQDPCWKVGI